MCQSKILVTGANGYIGHHVVTRLLELGHEVTAVDISGDRIDRRATFIERSIFDSCEDLYESLGCPRTCIHLAWRDGFNHSSDVHINDLPKHFWFVDHMLKNGVENLSIMGTMHEIGYWEGAVDENTPTSPMSLYGIAKNTLRQSSKLLADKYQRKLKWLRGYYVLGDDLSNHSIFTKILEREKAGDKTFPFVSGKNKYDFLDIHELTRQIVAAALQTEITGEINCCSGKPVSLGSRVEKFIADNNLKIRLEYGAFPDRPYDSPAIWGDNRKIMYIISKVNCKNMQK